MKPTEDVLVGTAAVRPGPGPLRSLISGRYAYPAGAVNINWFSLFNAVAWYIALGSPAVLFAKSLDASQTVLGLIAALTPLLVIFQLPAAHLLPKYGYRRFILAGWGSRTIFICGLAVVPLLTFFAPAARLWLALLCLFVFNLVRGVTCGAWMPWITEIIPDDLRGRFLCRDQIFAQVGCFFSLAVSSFVLSGNPAPWQFAVVFVISAIGQTISLWFLNRIPDVTAPDKLRRSGHRVPWKEMLLWRPFFRIVLVNLLYVAVVGGLSVFTVAYLRDEAAYSESKILHLQNLAVLGALASMIWIGPLMDRIGSKPVLRTCVLAAVIVLAGWWLIAAQLVGHALVTVAVLNLLWGIASTCFNVAMSRLSMGTMPAMGRNHFFALYTVITSLGWGIAPIIWGAFLDLTAGFQRQAGALAWNAYSLYFGLAAILGVFATALVSILHESPAPPTCPPNPDPEP